MTAGIESKSALHVLAFLYLVFSHTTDAELGEKEISAIVDILHKWAPSATKGQVAHVLGETAAWYNGIEGDAARFAEAERYAYLMRENMSATQLSSVVLNLIEIARVDGTITAAEDAFIARISAIFGLGDTRAT
jgi:uncharacterized tellurite resistance protein B-like protein